MTINRAGTTGGTMTEDKVQRDLHDQSKQAKPEAVAQESQTIRANADTPHVQRAAPGRMPLFRK
jgi:hypothetical protein